jgi:hypothetical protein
MRIFPGPASVISLRLLRIRKRGRPNRPAISSAVCGDARPFRRALAVCVIVPSELKAVGIDPFSAYQIP